MAAILFLFKDGYWQSDSPADILNILKGRRKSKREMDTTIECMVYRGGTGTADILNTSKEG